MTDSFGDQAIQDFRDACYFFEQTSLDSAANDYADYCTAMKLPLRDPKAMRNLGSRLVSCGLSVLAPNIKDMTVQDVLEDITDTSTVIVLNADKRPIRTITLNDALDVIEGALAKKRDLIAQERGDISIIRHPPDFPIVIPHAAAKNAAETYDDTLNTIKNLKLSRRSLDRQAEGRSGPLESEEPKKVHRAVASLKKDAHQIHLLADIVEDAKRELCAHETDDKKIKVLSDLMDVVAHELRQSIIPAKAKLPPPPEKRR